MQEKPFLIQLEATDQHTDQFILSYHSFHYPITINLEAQITFSSDHLRNVHLVWSKPAGKFYQKFLDNWHNVGIWLWKALLPESAPAKERETLAQMLRTEDSPLLLALPDSLAELPWELLCDPDRSGNQGFLALRRPLMRLSNGLTIAPPSPIESPLRLLLLISSPPVLGESASIDVESERAAVEQAVREMREAGFLHLFVEDIVTPKRVEHHLAHFRPHIIHYIGHGEYDQVDGGRILWEDDQGNELWFSAKRMASVLRSRDLHAVVLHACETARGNTRAEVYSLASTLAQAGLPAILAQQANFTYKSSPLASQAWYKALIAGKDMASALLAVRQALSQEERPDWAVPILQGNSTCLVPVLETMATPGPADPQLTRVGAAADQPTPPDVFVGRHREMRELHLMLEDASDRSPVLAIITGLGGIGKSTLVTQATRRYAGMYKTAPPLRYQKDQSSDQFLSFLVHIDAFLKGSGTSGFLADREEERKLLSTKTKIDKAVLALNAVGPVLLIIENLENVQNDDQMINDQDFLYLLRACLTNLRGGRVLVTGRFMMKELLAQETLETRFLHLHLDELSPDETRHLLLHYPPLAPLNEDEGKDDDLIDVLITELGGLPYVYNLLSSKFANENLAQIFSEVGESVTYLNSERVAEESQKVRSEFVTFATLEAIVRRLSTASRTLLARLSVLQQFPLGAMEKGLGAAQATWQQLLDGSLLHYEPLKQTYHLHSITRRYADDLLSKLNLPSPHARLATWYENYADHESHALEDYQEARRLWIAAGNHQRAGELVVTRLAEILSRLGLYQELRTYFAATLDAKAQIDENVRKEKPKFQAALNEAFQQDFAKGKGLVGYITRWVVRTFIKQTKKVQIEGPQYLQAQSHAQLGAIDQMEGKYIDAKKHYEDSLGNFKQLGNQNGRAMMFHSLGNIAYLQGNYAEARRRYKQSLAIFKRLGILAKQTAQRSDILDKQAAVLSDLGVLASSQGHYHKALQFCKKSLTIWVPLDYMDKHDQSKDWTDNISIVIYVALRVEHPKIWWVAQCFCMPILAILKRQDTQDKQAAPLHLLANSAQQRYEQILAVLEQVNAQDRQAATLHLLGNIAYAQRSYSEAKQLYQWCLAISKRVGNQGEQATIWHSLGNVAYSQRNYPDARQFYEQSLTLKEELGDQVGQAQSLGQLGMIAQKQKNYLDARQFYMQSLDICKKVQVGHKDGEATTLGQLGMLAYEQRYYEQALEHLGNAYVLFEKLHSPYCIPAQHGMARIRRFMDETTFTTLWQSISGGQPFPMLPNTFVENHWDNPGEESPFSLLPDGPQREQRDRVIKVVEAVYTPYLTLSRLPQILSQIRKRGKRRKKS